MPKATLPWLPPASPGKLKHTMFSKVEKGFNCQKSIFPYLVGLAGLFREKAEIYLHISSLCHEYIKARAYPTPK